MPRAGPLTPVDPHDLRLGAAKLKGWEIIPWILNSFASFGLMFLTTDPSSGRRVPPGIGLFLFALAWLVSWFAAWARERQARRGRRASWVNAWDVAGCAVLLAAIERCVDAAPIGYRWTPVMPIGILAVDVVKLLGRRRRALAATPAQRMEQVFE